MRLIWTTTLLVLASSGCSPDPCNGDVALCSRPLDEVVFPASHNSHAASEDGFHFLTASQDLGMRAQLEGGIRGMLIDFHRFEDASWLCHGECDILGVDVGRIPLAEGLGWIDGFLDDHRREVVILVLENYLEDDETVAGFEASGLADRVYAHELGQPWPTLGALIRRDRRVVVLDDEESAAPWLLPAYEEGFETPFSFAVADDAEMLATFDDDESCVVNRGEADHSLFYLNHFVTPSNAEAAAVVGAFEPLLARAERCAAVHGRITNLVTVDYWSHSDVLEVAATLNGLGSL